VATLVSPFDYTLQILDQSENACRGQTLQPWTNFSLQDKTWAEFTSLEVAVFMLSTHVSVKQNGQA
jgi:hypothetical protein